MSQLCQQLLLLVPDGLLQVVDVGVHDVAAGLDQGQ